MMMRAVKSALFLLILFGLSTSAAPVSLITNGGFESPGCASQFCTITAGTGLTGWTIEQGSIDLVTNAYWTAHGGTQSIDLNGNAPAVVRQTVSGLEVGAHYTLHFFLSGNPDMSPLPVNYQVTVDIIDNDNSSNNMNLVRNFSMAGETRPGITWNHYRYAFEAKNAELHFRFTGDTRFGASHPYGPVLDDVALYHAPEPGSISLFALGAAGLWFARRRRR